MFGYNGTNTIARPVTIVVLPGTGSSSSLSIPLPTDGNSDTGAHVTGSDDGDIGFSTELLGADAEGILGQVAGSGSVGVLGVSLGPSSYGVMGQASDATSLAVYASGKLGTSDSGTHTLGTYSGKSIPIYDGAAALIGYIPIYG